MVGRVYKPRYVYPYQLIKQSLQIHQDLLKTWCTVPDTKADVYDGKVWKDNLQKKQRSVDVMLNVANHTSILIVPMALFIYNNELAHIREV